MEKCMGGASEKAIKKMTARSAREKMQKIYCLPRARAPLPASPCRPGFAKVPAPGGPAPLQIQGGRGRREEKEGEPWREDAAQLSRGMPARRKALKNARAERGRKKWKNAWAEPRKKP